ncbi:MULTISPECIES: hypothetical protein [Clostridium]|jgi:hypothetical protein|uniref:Uncharacterized protein n=1 Tax=Clostridium lapidicellarium TaxID=3240931 RepID=A0ABV4E0H0_9CLOT|nr:hypothetical protein [uncultured Clostridium sp.]
MRNERIQLPVVSPWEVFGSVTKFNILIGQLENWRLNLTYGRN